MSESQSEVVENIVNLINSLSIDDKKLILNRLDNIDGIPLSAFSSNLSCLETLARYLRNQNNLSFRQISLVLNRKLPTVYTSYRNSKIKLKRNLSIQPSINIPFDVFKNRSHSLLESLIHHLHDNENMSFTKITQLINRSYSTVRTSYQRYLHK